MKILFICGSLEPGRDGVGDYTLRLCGELIRQGKEVFIIALNDKFVSEVIHTEQKIEDSQVMVLRIPDASSANRRFKYAKERINAFKPDWVSIQFVLFSFHSKGLPFNFNRKIANLTKGISTHVMFHELWIGMKNQGNLKQKLYSNLQKKLLNNFLKKIKPDLIHTHLPFYKVQLQKLGWQVKSLPLFSNIPASRASENDKKFSTFKLSFFSQIDASESVISFIKTFVKDLKRRGIKTELLLIGGKKHQAEIFKNLLGNDPDIIKVGYTGFIDSNLVSEKILASDLGISPVPRHALGKSSSLVSFFGHGVPVASPVVQSGFDPAEVGFFSDVLCSSILLEPDFKKFEFAQKNAFWARKEIEISIIVRQFLSDLNQ